MVRPERFELPTFWFVVLIHSSLQTTADATIQKIKEIEFSRAHL